MPKHVDKLIKSLKTKAFILEKFLDTAFHRPIRFRQKVLMVFFETPLELFSLEREGRPVAGRPSYVFDAKLFLPKMTYHTVFSLSESFHSWPILAILLTVLLLVWASNRSEPQAWKHGTRIAAAMLTLLLISFCVGWFKFAQLHRAYEKGNYSTVEGQVYDFQPMPHEGHSQECFSVQDKRFCYSDFKGTAGFNHTASHGGPIREGLYVRIAYVGNDILRVEVASSEPSVVK